MDRKPTERVKSKFGYGVLTAAAVAASSCATTDIPQAHRGRMFDRTGALAFYKGGKGLTGPILGPGSYFVGLYDQVQLVDCSTRSQTEPLAALTKDGVRFDLEVTVRFSANCSPEHVDKLLTTLTPDQGNTITSSKLYQTYVRPILSEAVLQVVSPYRATDINDRRPEILSSIRTRFMELIEAKQTIIVNEVNLSKPDFPQAINDANVQRTMQNILRDKAIAERERVNAEIETSALRRKLAEREGEEAAARIEKIGTALKRNPEYLQYDMQTKLPLIYRDAGAKGNMIIAAPIPPMAAPLPSAAPRGRTTVATPPHDAHNTSIDPSGLSR